MKIVATTFTGLEEVLKREIEQLGGERIKVHKRAVSYFGDKELLYRSNLLLRTAIRVLMPITDFIATDAESLYQKVYEIDWPKIFDVKRTFAVEAVLYTENFNHSGFVALKTKDAIVDRFRDTYGYRPNIDNKQPQVKINVHINNEFCTLSLDSSGEPLYKRGYRTGQGKAPMNEVLAAGLIQLSGWDKQTDLVDFMCGSGTIPIEAALYAANIPSQIKRTYFAFKFWKNYDKAMWDKIKEEEKSKIKEQLDVKIYASDRDGRILDVAKNNIKSAKVESYIELKHSSMEELQLPEGKKHIIVNPPYGRRLSVDVVKVYKSLGDVLRRYKGSEAWVFTDKREKLELMGLKPKEKYKIKTGAVSGYFYGYDIF